MIIQAERRSLLTFGDAENDLFQTGMKADRIGHAANVEFIHYSTDGYDQSIN